MTDAPARDPAIVPVLAYLLLGPLVWAVHLLLIYGGHAAICGLSGGAATGVATTVVTGSTVACLASLAWPLARPEAVRRRLVGPATESDDRFLVRAMRLLALLSAVGILWGGATAFLLPACAQLR